MHVVRRPDTLQKTGLINDFLIIRKIKNKHLKK